MRVLIVDDEPPARDKLRRLLLQENGVVDIAEAGDAYQALQKIATHRPDVLFLDIHMPEINGLELAASLPAPTPVIVFVTAFDHYAIRAFDANATDYLLKPYDQARLQRALQRVRQHLQISENHAAKIDTQSVGSVAEYPVKQLLISEKGVIRVIRVEDIIWIETADNYVILHTQYSHLLLRQTLTSLLEKLGASFIRCHRRAAVRATCIEQIISLDKGDAELLMLGGARVPCSRQYRATTIAAIV